MEPVAFERASGGDVGLAQRVEALKGMAARSLLLKREERGLIVLPERRQASPIRRGRKPASERERQGEMFPEQENAGVEVSAALRELPPLRIEEISHKRHVGKQAVFARLLERHHYLSHRCPVSGLNVSAAFPVDVEAPVQYGPHFRGLILYLPNQQLLPFDRLRQVYKDLFGQPLNAGTLTSINARASKALAPVEETIIQATTQSAAVHTDESGLRVEGKFLRTPRRMLSAALGVLMRNGIFVLLRTSPLCRLLTPNEKG